MATKLGIQLYTVRDALKADFVGTLRQLAKIGYDGIEYGSTGPLSVADFKALLQELNLAPIGSGAGIKALEGQKGDEFLARCNELGTEFLMISEQRDSAEGWRQLGKQLSAAGKTTKARGVTLQYHNHAHEFQRYDGQTALDLLCETADPDFLKFQLDVGWVQRAGEDPVAWLRKLKGRIRTIHLKDTTSPPDPQWTEVGTGVLPLEAVHRAAQELGVEWYLVEQDTCARPSLEAAAISCENARRVLAQN